jgi:hypothetical protein
MDFADSKYFGVGSAARDWGMMLGNAMLGSDSFQALQIGGKISELIGNDVFAKQAGVLLQIKDALEAPDKAIGDAIDSTFGRGANTAFSILDLKSKIGEYLAGKLGKAVAKTIGLADHVAHQFMGIVNDAVESEFGKYLWQAGIPTFGTDRDQLHDVMKFAAEQWASGVMPDELANHCCPVR